MIMIMTSDILIQINYFRVIEGVTANSVPDAQPPPTTEITSNPSRCLPGKELRESKELRKQINKLELHRQSDKLFKTFKI